jgi:hypothetical protein
MALNITGTLTISATTTFGGAIGFTTLNYSQIVAGTTVTLKSGATYTVTGQLTITGTAAQRCTLRGDTPISATGDVVSGGPTSTLTTTTSITITPAAPAGFNWIFSQSEANLGVLRRPVVGMNVSPVNSLTSFPKINTTLPFTGTSFILSRGFNMSSRGIRIGLSAKFIHTASGGDLARNINFVNTFDIDSLGSTGIIKADNSYQNRVGIPNPNLWRTLNWDSLNPLLPHVIVGYID